MVFALGAAGALTAAPARAAHERCGAPVVGGGQPALVAIVLDGIGSSEPVSGTSDPLAVANWCPVLPDGSPRRLAPGLDLGFRVWAGLSTGAAKAEACTPAGGLRTDACLIARLADRGAIVLPYSYAGARVRRTAGGGSEFTFNAYTAQTTYQEPATSFRRLAELIDSIAEAWPSARVVVVGHSYGGLVASAWWEQHVRDLRPVEHVYTLDSPINGVEQCLATAALFSPGVAAELCRRWFGRDAFDARLIALNSPQTLTTIGTPDDPAYDPPLTLEYGFQASGGGGLRTQVLYRCADAGEDPRSPCIAAPPSVVITDPACAGRGPGVYGRTLHHVVVACPHVTRKILETAATHVAVATAPRRAPVERPRTLRVGRTLVRDVRWSAFGQLHARGRGTVRGRRRSVVLSDPRPCDARRQFTYRRIRVKGQRAVRRAC